MFGHSDVCCVISHRLHNFQDELPSKLTARDLDLNIGMTVEIVGYLVNIKTTYTAKEDRMHFGTFLETEGMWIDTIHFPTPAKDYPFRGNGCYKLTGKVTEEFDFTSIEVHQMQRLAMVNRD